MTCQIFDHGNLDVEIEIKKRGKNKEASLTEMRLAGEIKL